MIDNNAVDRVGRDLVVTVATHDEGYISFFRESCARYNIDPIFLGQGAKWKGFGTKFNLMRDWIDTIQDDDRVLIVDCYDIVFLRPIDTLFRYFEQQAKNNADPYMYMYAASEPYSWPLSHMVGMHYGLYKGCVLNSGSFMAYGKLLKAIFSDAQLTKALNHDGLSDDQQLLTSYLTSHPDVQCDLDENRRFIVYQRYRLDVGARIEIDAKGKLWYRRDDDKKYEPYILHRSGNGPMEKILTELGYNITGIDTKSNHLHRILTNHVPYFFQNLYEKFIPPTTKAA